MVAPQAATAVLAATLSTSSIHIHHSMRVACVQSWHYKQACVVLGQASCGWLQGFAGFAWPCVAHDRLSQRMVWHQQTVLLATWRVLRSVTQQVTGQPCTAATTTVLLVLQQLALQQPVQPSQQPPRQHCLPFQLAQHKCDLMHMRCLP